MGVRKSTVKKVCDRCKHHSKENDKCELIYTKIVSNFNRKYIDKRLNGEEKGCKEFKTKNDN